MDPKSKFFLDLFATFCKNSTKQIKSYILKESKTELNSPSSNRDESDISDQYNPSLHIDDDISQDTYETMYEELDPSRSSKLNEKKKSSTIKKSEV